MGLRRRCTRRYHPQMAEIYTLSGPVDNEFGAAPPAVDIACAEQVKPLLLVGAATRISGVGVSLFGAYKLMKGKGAAGAVGLLGAGILWFAGGMLVRAAENSFESCRK